VLTLAFQALECPVTSLSIQGLDGFHYRSNYGRKARNRVEELRYMSKRMVIVAMGEFKEPEGRYN